MIGSPFPTNHFVGGELVLLYQAQNNIRPIQGTLYSLGGPLRTDLMREFPLSLRGNIAATKYLVPALLMLQLFYPDAPNPDSYLRLEESGALTIARKSARPPAVEDTLASHLRRMGYLSLSRWSVRPPAGSSIHYAGTLPMRDSPRHRYETDRNGKLFGTNAIFIADASCFPNLPAKNHSFTLMANACRVAHGIRNI